MSTRHIIDSFNVWRATETQLVLATVIATEGSTYSKAGHRILIAPNGDYRGLVSGGCLEGDLAAHAHTVFVTGDARIVTYDMREDDNNVWGMGVGCDGLIRILLQRLDADTGFEPFRTIAERQLATSGESLCVTVVESEDRELPTGATWIGWNGGSLAWRMPDDRESAIRNQSSTRRAGAQPGLLRQPSRGGAFTALHAPIARVPRLLILGSGPDAAPLFAMADQIGWLTTIVDHRQARIDDPAFATAEQRHCIALDHFPGDIVLDHYAAAIVMSHNLEADARYLSQLTDAGGIGYIGLLGPIARRDRLIRQVGIDDPEFLARLHGPAGLPIGSDSPETIALSILAEIHQSRGRPPE